MTYSSPLVPGVVYKCAKTVVKRIAHTLNSQVLCTMQPGTGRNFKYDSLIHRNMCAQNRLFCEPRFNMTACFPPDPNAWPPITKPTCFWYKSSLPFHYPLPIITPNTARQHTALQLTERLCWVICSCIWLAASRLPRW